MAMDFVSLRGVERCVKRYSHVVIGVLAGEGDPPWQMCGFAVAATCRKAAQAAECLTQSDSGSREIGNCPGWKVLFAQYHIADTSLEQASGTTPAERRVDEKISRKFCE